MRNSVNHSVIVTGQLPEQSTTIMSSFGLHSVLLHSIQLLHMIRLLHSVKMGAWSLPFSGIVLIFPVLLSIREESFSPLPPMKQVQVDFYSKRGCTVPKQDLCVKGLRG